MRIVTALGGNALLPRGQKLSAAAQAEAVAGAALRLAELARAGHQLVITHGNGPQVGLLALQSAAGPKESALPLDILGAESEGWIGYAIELALRNALPADALVVTLVTQVRVDADDPAFARPTKPIGPVYDEATAQELAARHGWSVAPDQKFWRRVVASPSPRGIVELESIRRLMESGAIVICAGGGGVPVIKDAAQKWRGVEAVIDKDATSALLACELGADMLVMLTDVDAVCLGYGTPGTQKISTASPAALRERAREFASGSMGPKVSAAIGFAEATGRQAAIGALEALPEIVAGRAGTRIAPGARLDFR